MRDFDDGNEFSRWMTGGGTIINRMDRALWTAAHAEEEVKVFGSLQERCSAGAEVMYDTVSCIHKQCIPYFPYFPSVCRLLSAAPG
jgi:hypothetical protein